MAGSRQRQPKPARSGLWLRGNGLRAPPRRSLSQLKEQELLRSLTAGAQLRGGAGACPLPASGPGLLPCLKASEKSAPRYEATRASDEPRTLACQQQGRASLFVSSGAREALRFHPPPCSGHAHRRAPCAQSADKRQQRGTVATHCWQKNDESKGAPWPFTLLFFPACLMMMAAGTLAQLSAKRGKRRLSLAEAERLGALRVSVAAHSVAGWLGARKGSAAALLPLRGSQQLL